MRNKENKKIKKNNKAADLSNFLKFVLLQLCCYFNLLSQFKEREDSFPHTTSEIMHSLQTNTFYFRIFLFRKKVRRFILTTTVTTTASKWHKCVSFENVGTRFLKLRFWKNFFRLFCCVDTGLVFSKFISFNISLQFYVFIFYISLITLSHLFYFSDCLRLLTINCTFLRLNCDMSI